MAGSYWRDTARETIKRVLAEVGTADPALLKKALFQAYPFGMRNYFPYRVWLDEIKKQIPADKEPPPGDQMRLF